MSYTTTKIFFFVVITKVVDAIWIPQILFKSFVTLLFDSHTFFTEYFKDLELLLRALDHVKSFKKAIVLPIVPAKGDQDGAIKSFYFEAKG